jgi:hypothetical protein
MGKRKKKKEITDKTIKIASLSSTFIPFQPLNQAHSLMSCYLQRAASSSLARAQPLPAYGRGR